MHYLYDEIQAMRQRPAMFLGEASITKMRSYLDGYEAALRRLGADQNTHLLPLPFPYFHEYVAHTYEDCSPTMGWKNILLQEAGGDEAKGLSAFYASFDRFIALTIKRCCKAVLNEQNITFHYTDRYAPKVWPEGNPNSEEPLYKDPIEVYSIELTDNAGCLLLVNTKSAHHLGHELYASEQDILDYVRTCFGDTSDWSAVHTDNIAFTKDVVIR